MTTQQHHRSGLSTLDDQLARVVRWIETQRGVPAIVPHLLEAVRLLFDTDRATAFEIDATNRWLRPVASTAETSSQTNVAKGYGSLVGFAALSRLTVNVANAYDETELHQLDARLRFDGDADGSAARATLQVLCVPIICRRSLLGVVELVNRPTDGPFTDAEVTAVEEIAKTFGFVFDEQRRTTSRLDKQLKYGSLIENGVITEGDVQSATREARMKDCSVEQILMDRNGVDKTELLKALSEYYSVPYFSYAGPTSIPDGLYDRLAVDFLRKNRFAPVDRIGPQLLVAVENPHDLSKVDAIRSANIAPRVELLVAIREDIDRLLDDVFDGADTTDELGRLDHGDDAGDSEANSSGRNEKDGEVVKLANRIIRDAYRMGVSDIHIEPYGNQQPTIVRFRTDGDCKLYKEIPPEFRSALISRIKIMARLDISEKRKPQDGKIRFRGKKGDLELRVATIPTQGGNEDIVMRILASSEPLPLTKMAFSARNLREWKSVLANPYGLVLVVGPTGSGKTTTLHSGLGFINTPDRKIWTAEDPVEITQRGLRQVQVLPKIGFDFATAMRAFLRADPDVIMVGEMRDRETAQTAIEASLTGHLVFSTLHTNSAAQTITRLLDMKLDAFSFANALLGILAQRLVRTLCGRCKEPYHPDRTEFEAIEKCYGAEKLARTGVRFSNELQLYAPRGCEHCAESGFRGRMAIHELIVPTAELRRLIVEEAPVSRIREQAIHDGMDTLMQDGVQKALTGHTTLLQVRSVCTK